MLKSEKQSLQDVFLCSQLEISEPKSDMGPGDGYPGRELRASAGKAGEKQCGDQVPAQPQEARSFTSRSRRRMILPRHQRLTSNHQTASASSLSPHSTSPLPFGILTSERQAGIDPCPSRGLAPSPDQDPCPVNNENNDQYLPIMSFPWLVYLAESRLVYTIWGNQHLCRRLTRLMSEHHSLGARRMNAVSLKLQRREHAGGSFATQSSSS